MTINFTIPDYAKPEEGFIEDEDYRDSYTCVLDNPDLYGYCGTDINECSVEGMSPNDTAYLEKLCPAPSYESSCHKQCYNNRTDEMDDYRYERYICESYYEYYAVYSVDKTAGKVFIAPRPPKRNEGFNNPYSTYRLTPVLSKCFGAEQERDDPEDLSEKPKNVIPVRHKKLDRCGYWLSVEQNQEFLWDWLGMIVVEDDREL